MINLNNIKFAGNIKTYNYVAPPVLGKALYFDGVDDLVTTGFIPTVDAPTTGSVSMWFKKYAGGSQWILGSQIQLFGPTRYPGFMVQVSPGNFVMRFGEVTTSTGISVTYDVWYHVVGTYDTGGNNKVYVNGTLQGENAFVGVLPNQAIYFGGYNNAVGFPDDEAQCIVDEIGIWSKILSQDEVTDLYNDAAGLYIDPTKNFPSGGSMGTNLEALWHIDEGTGLATVDSSGNGFTGSLTNMPGDETSWVDGKVYIP